MGSSMGAGQQKNQVMIRSLNFQPLPSSSRKEKGAGNVAGDLSGRHDEASIKVPKRQGADSFWVGKHGSRLGRWHL